MKEVRCTTFVGLSSVRFSVESHLQCRRFRDRLSLPFILRSMECLYAMSGRLYTHDNLTHLVLIHCRVPCLNQGRVVPYFFMREFTIVYVRGLVSKAISIVLACKRDVVIFDR